MSRTEKRNKPMGLRRALRWALVFVGALVTLLAIAAVVVTLLSTSRARRTYPVQDVPVTLRTAPEDLAEGERLSRARGCADCHGEDLAGRVAMDELPMMRMVGPNLTGGEGSSLGEWSDEDIARVIRYGVRPDGRAAFFMPAHEYFAMPDRELGRIVGYLRSLEPVDNHPGESKLGIVGRVLHLSGAMPMYPAELVDQDASPPVIDTSDPREFGAYLADACRGCHGFGLSGGPLPGAPPSIPTPSNLTPDESGLAEYTYESFARTMRTGVAADGRELSEFMPFANYASMTDDELGALWVYLSSLSPAEFGGR